MDALAEHKGYSIKMLCRGRLNNLYSKKFCLKNLRHFGAL
jgi:hypothetical protein